MRLLFTRHGESQANILHQISNRGLQHALTKQGRAQALELAASLRGRPLIRLFSSPILRAIETSVILASQLELDYEVVDALREYDCGILEGRSDEAAWQAWSAQANAWLLRGELNSRLEGGESFYDIQRRFEPFVRGLVEKYSGVDGDLVCVSHGGLYTMMLPLVLKNIDQDFISKNGIDYLTCITAEVRAGQLYCVDWNGSQPGFE